MVTMSQMPEAGGCPAATRILLVDDRPIFREGLTRVLEVDPTLRVVGDAHPDDAMRALAVGQPDVLLVGVSGRLLARMMQELDELPTAVARPRTILLTTTIEKAHVLESQHGAVHGILLLKASAQVLCDSIHSVAAGHCWFGLARVAVPCEQLGDRSPVQTGRYGLTQRELEIIEAVRRGETNKTIARQLSIALDTVKHHLTNIFAKIGVDTRLQLVVFALDHQLVHSHKMVVGGTPRTANTTTDRRCSASRESPTLAS